MVSHPETGSDSPIGSDRDWGRDKVFEKMPKPLSWFQISKRVYQG